MSITISGRLTAGSHRPSRSCARWSALLATSAATLAVALGGGIASATPATLAAQATSAAPAATGVSWHKLALFNGWQSSQTAYQSGSPSYAVSRGVVYLSGSMHGGTNPYFASLPAGARPAHTLYLPVYTFTATRGELVIHSDGGMYIVSDPVSNAPAFTSLAGVSFPTSAITRHKLTLVNGWTSAQVADGTDNPAYSIKDGVVRLSGGLINGTSSVVTGVPAAAHPAHFMYRSLYTYYGAPGEAVINSAGTIEAYGAQAHQFTSLAGIAYPAVGATWHKLTLVNGWKSTQTAFGTDNPAYTIINGVVYLAGGLHQVTGTNNLCAVLPIAARPTHVLYLTAYASSMVVGTVRIEPNGDLYAYSDPQPSYAQQFTSLATMSYARNS